MNESGPTDRLDALRGLLRATVELRRGLTQSACDLLAVTRRLDAAAFRAAGADLDAVRKYVEYFARELMRLIGLRALPPGAEEASVLYAATFGPGAVREMLEDYGLIRSTWIEEGLMAKAALAGHVEHLRRDAETRALSREEEAIYRESREALRALSNFLDPVPAVAITETR